MWFFNNTNTIWNRFLTFTDDILCRDADLVRRIGAATALEVKASGIHYNFAPCVAVRNCNQQTSHSMHEWIVETSTYTMLLLQRCVAWMLHLSEAFYILKFLRAYLVLPLIEFVNFMFISKQQYIMYFALKITNMS
jgi:hypothetical protein